MTLTIASTSVADIGVYHAEFAGLSLYPFNELCEQETVALLRPYPILSPAVFQVYASGKTVLRFNVRYKTESHSATQILCA